MINGVSLQGVSLDVLTKLNQFEQFLKKEIIVTSAFRKGDPGEHGKGLAVDIVVPGLPLLDLYMAAERFNWQGIGVYPTWKANGKTVGGLHLDLRTKGPARWMGLGSGKNQQYVALNQENLKAHGVI